MPGRSVSLLTLLSIICIAVPAAAQNKREANLRVEVHADGSLPDGCSLQLVETSHRRMVARADSLHFGGFSFTSLPPGDYMARLIAPNGQVIREQFLRFDGVTPVLRIDGVSRQLTARPSGDRISLRQLQNPPTKSAVKNFAEAQKKSEAGEYEKAAALLERAVQESPDFAEAHTNLGAQYLRMGSYEKAIEQANRAMEIAGPNSRDLSNRALAAWALGRLDEALGFANEALRLNSRSLTAHFIAGSLMVMKPDGVTEGMRHLEIAAEEIPSAARNLEKVREMLASK
jgi:hypothetical protein